jgi:hypothetical protein
VFPAGSSKPGAPGFARRNVSFSTQGLDQGPNDWQPRAPFWTSIGGPQESVGTAAAHQLRRYRERLIYAAI